MAKLVAVLFGTLFLLFGGSALWQGFGRLGRVGNLSSENATSVRDLQPDSWALVEGTVRRADNDPIPAQIAETDGYVVETTLEWGQRPDKDSHHPFHRQLDAVPFELEDETGSVRVDPPVEMVEYAFGGQELTVQGHVETPKAEYLLDEVDIWKSGGVPDTVYEWIESQGTGLDELPNSEYLRFMQGAIEPGESVLVYGQVTRLVDASPDVPAMTIDGGDAPEKFVLTDKGNLAAKQDVQQVEYWKMAFGVFFVLVGLFFVGLGITT